MAMQFTVEGNQVFKIDPQTQTRVVSSMVEYRATRAREKSTSLRAPGGIAKPVPAKDVSLPGPFKRGRSALISGLEKTLQPLFGETVGKIGRFAAETIIPETLEGTAAEGALLATSLLPGGKGPKALQKLLSTPGKRLITRAAAPGIAAGGVSAVKGEDPQKAALMGTAVGATELLGVPVRAGSRFIKSLRGQKKLMERGRRDIINVSNRITEAIPSLKGVLPAGDRNALTKFGKIDEGLEALRTVFRQSDAHIKKAFGKQKVSIEPKPVTMGTATEAPISVAEGQMEIGTLLQRVKDLKRDARSLARGTPEKLKARAEADLFETALKRELRTKDIFNKARGLKGPSLLEGYSKSVRDFRKGMPILEVMKKALDAKIIKETNEGAIIKLGEFAELLNRSKVSVKEFSGLYATATRGRGPGFADVTQDITARVIAPRVGAGNIRLPQRFLPAGFTPRPATVPGPAQLPVSASVVRLFDMLSGSPMR